VPGLLSRLVDPRAGMSLVWGAISAGVAPNTIPETGLLRGTVRVLDRDAWGSAEELVRTLVTQVAAVSGAQASIEYVRGVPPVVNDPRNVALLRAAAVQTVGLEGVVLSPQSMGGEDFGWFAEAVPIALARLGTSGGGPPLDLHRGTFDVDESALSVGVRLMSRVALQALAAETAGSTAGERRPGHAAPVPGPGTGSLPALRADPDGASPAGRVDTTSDEPASESR
jgi:amidohydrolase